VWALAAGQARAADEDVSLPVEEEVPAWQATLDRVVRSVVSIRVTATRDFDTEDASVSQGTGFIVDAERGLVLTNRHMVHAGPVVAEAVLMDHEVVPLRAVYRDPVHDFGFYRLDPETVRHMDLKALALAPEAARVGTDIRVVGNDAGEKLSILDSTIARLDRNAPSYGPDEYNDFNTFYFQAASNTSGGSSGSPVVDVQGRVVALNAGGSRMAASSFYLPLDRVVRALDLLRDGAAVPRGTLETVFLYTAFDELARLGLTPELEERVRDQRKSGFGMLVVDEVLPEGPADDLLKPGDILTAIDGELVTDFVGLETRLDGHVGVTLDLEVLRGGRPVSVAVPVGDLHAITPDRYLEVGRGVVHALSYQQARNHLVPVHGVYLAVGGYMWSAADPPVPAGAVLTHVDGVETPDLPAFTHELEGKGDGQRLRVRFSLVSDERRSFESVVVMDRRWHPMQTCVRDDATGTWPCTASPPPPPLPRPQEASRLPVRATDRVAARLERSLVLVDFDIPHPTAGVSDLNYVGVGTVVDAAQGLVVVDRDTVPVALGDMTLTFAGTVRVPGRLVVLHPVHNLAFIAYDPSLVADLDLTPVTFDADPTEPDDRVWQVGLDGAHDLVSSKTRVEEVAPLVLGVSTTPRFRDTNVDAVWIEDPVESYGGVLVDRRGHARALWASFLDPAADDRAFYGLPAALVADVLPAVRAGEQPVVRTLGVELTPIPLSSARDRGLSDARVGELLDHDPDARQALEVQRVSGAAPAYGVLRDTDIVLAIDGEPVTSPSEVEELQKREVLQVTVLRDGAEKVCEVHTTALPGTGVDRVVSWAGLVLHEPHVEVAAQQGIEARGVYVAWLWFGSPAQRYGIRPTRRIVAVDDLDTPDLDTFLAAVRGRPDGAPVRLTLETLEGAPLVQTLRTDLQYWPTQVLTLVDGLWVREEVP
jgi:S1-C subfamily serine protease